MCIVPLPAASTTTPTAKAQAAPPCAAKHLDQQQRLRIARDVLAGEDISQLAQQYGVSCKFIRVPRNIALDALDRAFNPLLAPDQKVLFHLPVTRQWLEQLSLALVLVCHSSLRGVHEILRDLFDCHRSIGAIHADLAKAIARATSLNAKEDLSGVLKAALDEIFQGQRPVLSVVDVPSTYCCLLSLQEHRDGDTWAICLFDLQEQGFDPTEAVADAGKGARAGLVRAGLGHVMCKADIFHAIRDLGQLVRFLENRAYAALGTYDKRRRQVACKDADAQLLAKADAARREAQGAVALADDVAVLAGWLHHDVLAVAGPSFEQRQELFDFVLLELLARQPLCEHRLKPVCSLLSGQKADLLAFVEQVDVDIASLAAFMGLPEELVREMVAVQELPQASVQRWQRDPVLHEQLGARYHQLSEMVQVLRAEVVRASSVVENVNSRVRNYFFLRKEVGQGYLELLRFFLNHRRFLRSEHPERQGKSPAELLNGQEHEHWLEMLGYALFRRAA
jgi:hypothetical protein